MKLVVGLGNPGGQYLRTRHNIGFEVVDALAQRLGWIRSRDQFVLLAKSKFDGLVMNGLVGLASGESEKVLLLKPMTYMNLSGQSVQAAKAFFQILERDVMVVLDDLALPCGKLRMRPGGSNGGHNGLRDIERALGTSEYSRLRIGLDAPPPRMAGRDYVLGRATDEQRKRLDPAVDRAAEAIVMWMEKGIESAMSRFNANDEGGTMNDERKP
ncbi:MAG: aminoacyl-tRNA hydrolase [Planctomycetota bacterium]|nr:aminoacyl-tRNA hydrolase [Planctomycetota bacterium]